MRKIKCIPSSSGLFGLFNVNVIIFALSFYVSMLNISPGLRYTHVFQMLSNNRTYLECLLYQHAKPNFKLQIIIGGDFNCTLADIDKKGGNPLSRKIPVIQENYVIYMS